MGSRHKSLCMFATTLLKSKILQHRIKYKIYIITIILSSSLEFVLHWKHETVTVRLWFMARVNSEVNLKETLWILTINLRLLEKKTSIFLFCITHHSCHSHSLPVLFPAIVSLKNYSWWFQPNCKICSSKWDHLPQIGMKIKHAWNHQPVFHIWG